MKISVLIPVFNEANHIPTLLRSLAPAMRGVKDLEILFIDNGSTDGSLELLEASKLGGARVLREPRRGFAAPLNRGTAAAAGELLLFLDADAQPAPGWAARMEKALRHADVAVGATFSLPPKKITPYGRVAAKIFEKHSERTAHAQGHALPWGPTCNLGMRRSMLEKTGPFSPEAASAFDIDWCWRAVLKGARLVYAPAATVKHARRNERQALLEQFERYGLGEAWLHRTYSFLLTPEDQEPNALLAGVNAFLRLRHQGAAAKVKSLAPILDEVATAFAGGVRIGFDRAHHQCSLPRAITTNYVAWESGFKSTTIFVPGKGLAELGGQQRKLFLAMQNGASEHELVHLFMKLFKATHKEAEHEVAAFRLSLTP